MSHYEKVYGHLLEIPKSPEEQDEFIGVWRRCQQFALDDIYESQTYVRNFDDLVDRLTVYYYLKITGGNYVHRRKLETNRKIKSMVFVHR